MARPKICVLFAGGTIGMIRDTHTGALRPAIDASDIIRDIPDLQKAVQIHFELLMNFDSSNMIPSDWTKIAQRIYKLYDQYDGFVLLQGTDTMSYTASALSFSFRNLSKPIILTGSLIPMSELGADARNNLIYACLTAAMDIAEVCIVFANRIIRGNRSKKHHESFVDVFHSPNYPYLGELGRPTVLQDWRRKRRKRSLIFHPHFNENISVISLFPGFNPDTLRKVIDRGVHGVILEGFGPGNVPFRDSFSIIPVIEYATQSQIPVVIANQLEHGITNLHAYEAGYRAAEHGAISSFDMTLEATITKFMWVLSQTRRLLNVRRMMEKNISGELKSS